MIDILNRFAWWISFLMGGLIGLMISSLFSGIYSSAGEIFFSGGWIAALIIAFLCKGIFLSRSFIESSEIFTSIDPSTLSSRQEEIPINDDADASNPLSQYRDETITVGVERIMQVAQEDTIKQELYASIKPTPSEPKKPNWLVVFFSDRPLAKIGGILLFLGALFFLSLIWAAVGSVGKILIGILFGIFLYIMGVWMDHKGHITESRTLMGVGIAINTLTILSGRWIIGGDTSDAQVLGDGITLLFLLLNTAFAVATALVYTSRTFLIFSFVFAYLIPFLTGSESSSIFLILAYNTIISVGGYLLSVFLMKRGQSEDALWLFRTIFIGSLILLGVISFGIQSTTDLILYIIALMLLVGVGTCTDHLIEKSQSLTAIVIGGYIALVFAMISGGALDSSILVYMLAIVPLMVVTVMYIVAMGASVIASGILFFPLVIAIFLLAIFGAHSMVSILVPIVFFYGIASFFVLSSLTVVFQYAFFVLIGIFLSICSVALNVSIVDIPSSDRLVLATTALIFFCFSVWTAIRQRLDYLTLLSGVVTAILLAIILSSIWQYSWIFYGFFLLVAFVVPFLTQKYTEKIPSISIIAYQVIINLFMILELVYLGKDQWFSGTSTSLITLGCIVFALSIGSTLYSLGLIRSAKIVSGSGESYMAESSKNLVYALFAIPISLFSLSIAIVFSNNAGIVAAAWVVESTVLAYMYHKIRNTYILTGSIILLAIGLLRLIPFFDAIQPREWILLMPIMIIALGLFAGATFLTSRKHTLTNVYDVLHIAGVATVGLAIMQIIPHSSVGWSILGISVFVAIATWIYQKCDGIILSVWNIVLIIGFFLLHLSRIDTLSMDIGPFIVQMIGLVIAYTTAWFYMKRHMHRTWVFALASVLALIITSLYVNDITHNVFAVTIYLTLISAGLIFVGIEKDRSHLRTAGLYIGTFVLIKILFYDLWYGFDNLIIRVLALMISGGVMIALSQLYGKSVKRGWAEEFSFENFTGGTLRTDTPEVKKEKKDQTENISSQMHEDMPFSPDIADDMKSCDISDIVEIELYSSSGEMIFQSKRIGVIRIVAYITQSLKKTEFAAGELLETFDLILPHIRSALPKKDLDAMLLSIEKWISLGGSVEIIKKSSY